MNYQHDPLAQYRVKNQDFDRYMAKKKLVDTGTMFLLLMCMAVLLYAWMLVL